MFNLLPRSVSAHKRSVHAQSLVEFALLVPLLMLILLGAIDLGRAFSAYVAITNAAREGARYGSAHFRDGSGNLNAAAMANRAIQEASLNGIVITSSDVQVVCAPFGGSSYSAAYCASATMGDQLRVTVTHSFQFFTLYLFNIPNVMLNNSAVMAIIRLNAWQWGGRL